MATRYVVRLSVPVALQSWSSHILHMMFTNMLALARWCLGCIGHLILFKLLTLY
jgi:hypothetical protein